MIIPPGLTASDFKEAINDFRKVVGDEWVFTSDEHVATYRDDYSILRGTEQESLPSAAVAPDSTEKVQQVMRIANKYQIPTWVISSGKNFAYGGPESRVRGTVVVDLKRMNKIIEIDEKRAYAIVEPGVSQHDLWLEIQKRGLKLWIDGPAPAYSSIIANALERGVGYGLASTRVDQICGMEVVLPTGDVMRTGMGAMSTAKTSAQYPYGLGPYVDGMFSQSNFGIVTQMGVWLIPESPVFEATQMHSSKYDDIVPMIDTLYPLRLQGVIRNGVSLHPYKPGIDLWKLDLEDPLAPFRASAGTSKPKLPGWGGRLGFYGTAKVVDALLEQTKDEYSSAIPGIEFDSKRYSQPYDPSKMDSVAKMAAGIPSFQALPVWDHSGMNVSMVFPTEGSEYFKLLGIIDGVFKKYGRRYIGGAIHNHVARSTIALMGVPVSRTDPKVNTQSIEMASQMIDECAKQGYGEYRAPLALMDHASKAYDFNNNALLRFNETIKDALDPNGIFSPGKNGVWPKRMREDKA